MFPLGGMARSGVARLALPQHGIGTKRFENYQRLKARLDRVSGVTGWTLHDLRRTFASGLAARGVSLPTIERLLNHVSGSFGGIVAVYQRYDFMPEMRRAIDSWEQYVAELVITQSQLPLLEYRSSGASNATE